MKALSRRTILKTATSLPFASVLAAQSTEPGLRAYAAKKGLLYGAAAGWPMLRDDADYAKHFAAECNLLVPENVLKMGPVHPEPERYNFEPGDYMMEFCQKHDLRMRGHTLVWHSQGWPWLKTTVNATNARKYLEEHIRTVAGHYKGRMHSWDVVNEAVEIADGREDGLRKTAWLEFLGPEYLDIAFHAAHAADPEARLTYNDYGLDYDTPGQEKKREAVLRLLRGLKDRKAPIHALGTQAHLDWKGFQSFKAETLQRFLRDVASLGLEIYITELDVGDRDLPDDEAERDRGVARVYEEYLTAALEVPAVKAVLTWGLTDRYTWLAGRNRRPSGLGARVLPLDRDYRRKPAWQAIARAIESRKA
jgi:endo-1,4-beta-xylanase